VKIDSLWTALSCWCLSHQVAPSLVSARSELAEWILSGNSEGETDRLWPRGWKHEFAGGFLAPFLSGDLAVSMEWKEDRLQRSPDHRTQS